MYFLGHLSEKLDLEGINIYFYTMYRLQYLILLESDLYLN